MATMTPTTTTSTNQKTRIEQALAMLRVRYPVKIGAVMDFLDGAGPAAEFIEVTRRLFSDKNAEWVLEHPDGYTRVHRFFDVFTKDYFDLNLDYTYELLDEYTQRDGHEERRGNEWGEPSSASAAYRIWNSSPTPYLMGIGLQDQSDFSDLRVGLCCLMALFPNQVTFNSEDGSNAPLFEYLQTKGLKAADFKRIPPRGFTEDRVDPLQDVGLSCATRFFMFETGNDMLNFSWEDEEQGMDMNIPWQADMDSWKTMVEDAERQHSAMWKWVTWLEVKGNQESDRVRRSRFNKLVRKLVNAPTMPEQKEKTLMEVMLGTDWHDGDLN